MPKSDFGPVVASILLLFATIVLFRFAGTRLTTSIGSATALGCILFILYRWRIAFQSRERKRAYYLASAIIVLIAASIPYSR